MKTNLQKYLHVFYFFIILSNAEKYDTDILSLFLKEYVNNDTPRTLNFVAFAANLRSEKIEVRKLFFSSIKSGTFSRIQSIGKTTNNTNTSSERVSDASSFAFLEKETPSSDIITLVNSSADCRVVEKLVRGHELGAKSWVLFVFSPLKQCLQHFDLQLNNKIKALELPFNNTKVLNVWEAYRPSDKFPVHYSFIGKWDYSHTPKLRSRTIEALRKEPWYRRSDLFGMKIKSSIVNYPPFNILKKHSDGSMEDIGIMGKFFGFVLASLNATSELHVPANRKWGIFDDESGKWTGIIGDLVEGRADIATTFVDITYSRSKVIEFIHNVRYARYSLVIKTSKLKGDQFNSYIKIFSPTTWLLIGVFLTVISGFLRVSANREPNRRRFSHSEALFMVFGASLCNQALPLNFTRFHGRFIALIMFTTGFLLNIYYSSSLISSLTVNSLTLPFRGVFGLYDARAAYNLKFIPGSALENQLQESPRQIIKAIRKEMVKEFLESDDKPTNFMEASSNMKDNDVYLLDANHLLAIGLNCNLTVLPEVVFKLPTAFAMKKGSPLLPIIRYKIIKYFENGVYNRLEADANLPSTNECGKSSTEALSLTRLISLFILYGIGVVLASIFLTAEIFMVRWKQDGP